MMKKWLIILLLALLPSLQAVEYANPSELSRRIYLDLLDRTPTVEEYHRAKGIIAAGKYASLVKELMTKEEYFDNLASKMIKHYSPVKGEKTHDFVSYLRLKKHVRDNYLGPKSDIRDFVNDLLTAKGVAAQNNMVLFYSNFEDSAKMTARLSASILGVPMKCAQCHDHKIHPDINVNHFWSMAAFFEGMDKKIVATMADLKKLEKNLADDKYSKTLGKENLAKTLEWVKLENDEKSIYSTFSELENMGRSGTRMGLTEEALDEVDFDDEDTPLQAPQLFINESVKSIKALKIDYELDGMEYTSTASHFKRDRALSETARPRDVLSKWMSWKEPLYMSRAVANWVTNWFMGRGYIMPFYDTYKVEGPNGSQLDRYAQLFMRSKFNIHAIVRAFVMSPTYRMKSSIKSDEEKFAFFKSRRIRHLSGTQVVNSLNRPYDEITKGLNTDAALKKLYRVAVYKQQLVDKIFPVSIDDTEVAYKGTLVQALKLSTDTKFLAYADKLAKGSFDRFRGTTTTEFLDYIFAKLYTRVPTKPEIAFFKAKLDFAKSYRSSGVFETVWTLMNSPEMRLY
ncbi:MAG: DUF1549 domain-containing protein [Lentisphaeraceae bacterium]|nr:DUF1549 domain-containing protein [Lentisphaeraceae bacterium]